MFGYTIIKTSELEAMKERARTASELDKIADRYRRLHKDASDRLDYWERHGQLRDPATGRLVPKARTTA